MTDAPAIIAPDRADVSPQARPGERLAASLRSRLGVRDSSTPRLAARLVAVAAGVAHG